MSNQVTPENARQFALWVVQKLRDAGHEALWAGGCVRDELLGQHPSDYDVATSATPQEVRLCFGYRRTLAIGAAFGVITVVGRREQGQIEVATFRCDAAYSDGRHPDHVSFSTAREDALRRDFTINGLFFDPIAQKIIDYVDGRQDLEAGIVRAIGDPYQRFAEDKLRMLRAVRFAATFGFAIEADTLAAVQREAGQITVVSAERIAAELRKMLAHPPLVVAVQLLLETRLLAAILPESCVLFDSPVADEPDVDRARWRDTIGILQRLREPTFRVALAGFLWGIHGDAPRGRRAVERICERWKLSNHEKKGTLWLLANERAIRRAPAVPWPTLQRLLVQPAIDELLVLADAVARQVDEDGSSIEYCRRKLAMPAAELNPAPLITGDDLREAGLQAGPLFRRILETVRDAQLERQIATRGDALALARTMQQRDSAES